ncbi:hypothetical protein [Arthrobacter sp. H5]|uniref:hypothetical protein n=1 Tax=Arthrobacter sp. H5 TaxID=1267973 RepID=UPI0004BAC885|nr:hypothetical protein [Arthrobacter sp. H5]
MTTFVLSHRGIEAVDVAMALPLSVEVTSYFEFGDDQLFGALDDSHDLGDVPQSCSGVRR